MVIEATGIPGKSGWSILVVAHNFMGRQALRQI
jgi:hypothetical protein